MLLAALGDSCWDKKAASFLDSLSPNPNLGKAALSSPHTRLGLGGWHTRGVEASDIQNKEEIQGGRSFSLPGTPPAAIWLRGLLFKPLDRGLFVFQEFAADYFHQIPYNPLRWLPLQANLRSQPVLPAGFTVPSQRSSRRALP